MTIKPGTKKITASLEEANFLTMLIERVTQKGTASVVKTSVVAKECMIDQDEANEMIENLANRGILTLLDTEGDSLEQGQAEFTSLWAIESINITLKAQQKGLPGTGESEETEEEEEEDENE